MANKMEAKQLADWLSVILAAALFISPWVLKDTVEMNLAWNAWISAVIIGAVSIAALLELAHWKEWEWLNLPLGGWVALSPGVLGVTAELALWTQMVLGVLIVAAAVWAIIEARPRPHAHA
jgi:hypothetical protein